MIASARSLLSLLILLALTACVSIPSRSEPPIPDSQVTFVIRPGTTTEGNLSFDLGVHNNGDFLPANDDFNGVWRLSRDSETRASGIVHQLQQLAAGETILMHWDGRVEPGEYELIWGATGYGHTEANFEVFVSESGGLRLGEMAIFETTVDPPADLVPLTEENGTGQ